MPASPARPSPSLGIQLFVIWGTALALAGLGLAIAHWGPANPGTPPPIALEILLPTTVEIYPKPLDRLLFVVIALAAPLFLAGATALASRASADLYDPRPVFWSLVATIVTILIAKSAVPELSRLLAGRQWLLTLVCLAMASILSLLPAKRQDQARWIAVGTVAVIGAAMISSQRIFTLANVLYGGLFASHYEAVTSAAVRIASGGTCLVDVIPQYGCYGEFLAPILALTGSSVLAVSSVYAILTIAALSAVCIFIGIFIRNTIALVGCLLAMLVAVGLNLIYDNPDPILQYFPTRFVFPASSIFIALWLQNGVLRPRFFIAGLFAGAAVCWNLESGLAVTGALGLFSAVGNFTEGPLLQKSRLITPSKRSIQFILGATAFVCAFIAYLYLKSGSLPDVSKFFLFQTVFYITGFGMIPIPALPDYWTMHLFIILSVFFLAALHVASKTRERDRKLEIACYISIMAAGLILYYSGRSHVLVLRLVAWPSIILFFFLLDRALDRAQSMGEGLITKAVAVLCCALPAAFLMKTAPAVASLAVAARSISPSGNADVREDIVFIRTHAAKNEPVAIIGLNQGILYGEARVRAALEGPGVAEMIRRVDLNDQMDSLARRGPQKIFIADNTAKASDLSLLGTNVEIDLDKLRGHYGLAAKGPGGRLSFLRRKPYDGIDLWASSGKN